MKKTILLSALVLIVFSFAVSALAANIPSVEVLYMNHGPMQPVVKQLKDAFSTYGVKIKVAWYDLNTGEGQKFMAGKGIREHVPLVIWIDGSHTVKLPQGAVKFVGFPSGTGPEPFQGKWTVQDVKAALDQATAAKR